MLYGCILEALHSNKIDSRRSIDNPVFFQLGESDIFRKVEQERFDMLLSVIAKSDLYNVKVSSLNNKACIFNQIELEQEETLSLLTFEDEASS